MNQHFRPRGKTLTVSPSITTKKNHSMKAHENSPAPRTSTRRPRIPFWTCSDDAQSPGRQKTWDFSPGDATNEA